MKEPSVAPGLLLAMPQLPDPNFRRAVVLMLEHSDGGSWGLVVNRPTEIPIHQVLDQLEMPWQGEPDAVIWQGGPVEPQRGCVLHTPRGQEPLDEALPIVTGLALSTLPEQLQALAEQPPPDLRFMLGYAGWGPGQLELEMAHGSWLVAPVSSALVFDADPDGMWTRAITSLGIDPTSLVPAEGIH
jgi:putative transcriptional regulator